MRIVIGSEKTCCVKKNQHIFILCMIIIKQLMFYIYIYKERKTFFLNEQKSRDAAAKKYRYKRSRDK